MSMTLSIMEWIRGAITGKTDAGDDKIFLNKPSAFFVGQGPVILIYPTGGDRDPYHGDKRFHTSSLTDETFAIDVLVDDYYNNIKNENSLRLMMEIKDQIEVALFTESRTAIEDLSKQHIGVWAYRPGSVVPYELETKDGIMIATRTELKIAYVEEWTRATKDYVISKHNGSITTTETGREFDFEIQ